MVDSDLTLRVEHYEGSTSRLVVPTPTAIDDELVTLVDVDIERSIDEVTRCEVNVFRDEWLESVEPVLDRRNDEFYVEDSAGVDIFGGRLDDWEFGGLSVSVQMDNWERDPLESEPPAEFERDDVGDDEIASDLIALMPSTIQEGTVEQTQSDPIGYESWHHHTPGRMLRSHAEEIGAEVLYHPDGTVDYLDRRGEDRHEEISPEQRVVISEPRVRKTVREVVTNVRAYSREDHSIYEEATAISTDSDERQVWDTAEIDSEKRSRIQAHATEKANEYADAPEYIEVDVNLDPILFDRVPEVGDTYPVVFPEYDIDDRLRVIESNRSITGDGDVVNVLLSNRKMTLLGR